jgi:uracil-DNA glycosylase
MTARLWDAIPAPWQDCLASCRSELDEIEVALTQAQLEGQLVVPDIDSAFAALAIAPSEIGVVVIGQDPYPTPGHATGLAFAVPVGTAPLPGSLRNIFKEVALDIGSPSSADCTLTSWRDQGVLLLNTSLTTVAGQRAAHSNLPWGTVVQALLKQVVAHNPNVVAALWGNHAKQFASTFNSASIVESAHPSPLSANRGFLGSRPFTRINEILAVNERQGIRW